MKFSELDDSENPNLIKNLEDELYEIRKEEREQQIALIHTSQTLEDIYRTIIKT